MFLFRAWIDMDTGEEIHRGCYHTKARVPRQTLYSRKKKLLRRNPSPTHASMEVARSPCSENIASIHEPNLSDESTSGETPSDMYTTVHTPDASQDLTEANASHTPNALQDPTANNTSHTPDAPQDPNTSQKKYSWIKFLSRFWNFSRGQPFTFKYVHVLPSSRKTRS